MSVTGSSVVGGTEAIVKSSLAEFVHSHTGQDVLSIIDDIVLSYVVGIVESLSAPDSKEDAHDVEQFTEMIAAYIPAFATINTDAVSKWMFDLSSRLSKSKESKANKDIFDLRYELTKTRELQCCYSSGSSGSIESLSSSLSTSPAPYSSSSRSRSTSQSDEERLPHVSASPKQQQREELAVLSEMFPHLSLTEVQQSLSASSGDCQRAAQLLLLSGDDPKSHHRVRKESPEENALRDKKFREQILNRYGFIDRDDDEREHKPLPPKSEPKKLIRYRDNKIVSVKGERYSEVRGEEDDGETKKTYVTLKPARQYRFH